jgi:hypothetical protein
MSALRAFPVLFCSLAGSRASKRLTVMSVIALVGLLSSVATAGAVEAKPFGIAKFSMQTIGSTNEQVLELDSAGHKVVTVENTPSVFTQAGGHPWALATTGEFTSEEIETEPGHPSGNVVFPSRDPKDVVVNLPPGLLGDPLAVPRCSLTQLVAGVRCPPSTQVGVAKLRWLNGKDQLGPIVNLTPEAGQSAEFGLENQLEHTVLLTAHLVRSENPVTHRSEYGFTVVTNAIPEVELSAFELTFWGVPADPSHDPLRGLLCDNVKEHVFNGPLHCVDDGGERAGVAPVPFLTWPSDCSAGPEVVRVRADSWQEPGSVSEGRYSGYAEQSLELPGVTGCGLLGFNAGTGIAVEPDTRAADEPVGLGVNLRVPLSEGPASNATPLLRDTRVTLPQGVSVSPGVVDGVKACNEFGPEGINISGPESEQVGLNGELQLAPGHCPDASIVGEAEAITPFLPFPVKGHVYLARPGCGGAGQAACTEQDALDGNLYRLYLEIGGEGVQEGEGIVFKVPLETKADPATGQLTTDASDLVQAPYSEVRIRLNGGPRAPLDNPAVCGATTTTADFTPWSAPGVTPQGLSMPGTADVLSSSFFGVEGCSSPSPFSPGFVAGTVSPQAGQFSAFTMNLSRQDREQYVKGIQVHTPPGLLGMLSSVPLCEEPQADSGHCPESSRIGRTTVASGAGSHPFEISGDVYLTKSYRGAPFGLSIVTNAVAGPFNLGLVVVRARIDVDPENSTLTITTDETGPYAIPQIIFGVPLRLQRITVDIDRPGFMFNPTSCNPLRITANVSGSQQAVASVSSAFAVGGCESLAFKPSFTVSTSGRTSKADGASLDAKVSYPAGSVGSEANIASVKVELPKQLPSRLTTLQKACTAAQFDSDPAGCPQASIVGIVKASTPLLPVGLSGPVYFVSHGGEAFPSLIVVLQGDGVRVDLTGATFISKAGITSSTFKTVPDVPVSSFELYLPEGKFSALAADGNLCALTSTVAVKRKVSSRVHGRTVQKTVTARKTEPASLIMPTEMVAQNGAVLKQDTKLEVTGCPTRTTSNAKAKTKVKAMQGKGKAKKAGRAGQGRAR